MSNKIIRVKIVDIEDHIKSGVKVVEDEINKEIQELERLKDVISISLILGLSEEKTEYAVSVTKAAMITYEVK
ncbi:MAG: hypothetical protein JZU53_04665 [Paludibacter sp.]|nr:hypothetical protein [Paludibacter sp.]